MDLYQLVYVSRANQSFSLEELHDLLDKAKKNNYDKGITGTLLYNGGVFLQVLEGDKNLVLELFESISNDPRHKNVRDLYFEPAKFRLFGQWSMNMINLDSDNPKNLTKLKEIIDAVNEDTMVDNISAPVRLLQEFQKIT